jgi:transcriptional regulator with XRE-family HTH domain
MLNIVKIETYRKKKKLHKQDFAKAMGMLPSNYSMMLASKSTTLETLDRIAAYMKTKARNLIF